MRKRWLCRILALVLLLGCFAVPPQVQAASAMTSSEALVTFVKTMEGFSKYPYSDYGQYSVGYGTKCPSNKYNEYMANGIPEADAVALLKKELNTAESALNSFIDRFGLTMEQHQFDALVSFTFNCGTGWLSEYDGYLNQAVRSGDTGNGIIYALGLWSKAGGQFILHQRRMCEANLYINGIYNPYNGTELPYPDSYRWIFFDGCGGTVRYAIWCYDAASPVELNVTFKEYPTGVDANGNSFTYQLEGWYTAGGTRVTVLDDSLSRDQILYAKWVTPNGDTTSPPVTEDPVPDDKEEEEEEGGSEPVTPAPVEITGIPVTVTGTEVRIRTGPGLSYSHAGWNNKGDQFTVTEIKAADGYTWGKFTKGWVALEFTNFATSSGWVTESAKWVYYEQGAKVKNAWRSDGVDLCWLGNDGYRVTNDWVNDGSGWQYVDAKGYRIYNQWIQDGIGWAWVSAEGYRVFDQWLEDSAGLRYVDAQGYRVIGALVINGHTYRFDGNGLLMDYYTVEFLDWDGTVLGTGTYKCADPVVIPEDPTRASDGLYSYTFAGWDREVTDCCGAATYTAVYEATRIYVPNAILEHPQAVTVNSGETVQFTVRTQGEVLSYKWEYRKIWKWFDTTMEGFDTDTLTIPAVGNRNGYDYRCTITFTDGTVLVSNMAELTVLTQITNVHSPNDQTVVLGYKGQFTASATGEGLKYQWQYQRPDGTKWFETTMEGADQSTVMIETTAARHGYKYRCMITDVTGNVVYTDVATMSVLSFTSHPKSVTVKANAVATFTVSTSVPEGFTYQWQYSRNGGETWFDTSMDGYNTDTLQVSATMARNGYQYRCVLTGSKNSKVESKAATLTVTK